MTILKIADALPRADVVVVAVGPGPELVAQGLSDELRHRIEADLSRVGCDGSAAGTWRVPAPEPLAADSVVAVTLGADLREAVGDGVRAAGAAGTVAVSREERVPDFANIVRVLKGETVSHRLV